LGENDEDEDDAVGGNNNNADDVGEDELVEDVIDAEDVVEGVETNTKIQKRHYEAWVNSYNNMVSSYNNMVSFYNTNCHCIVKRRFATAEGRMLGNWVHDPRKIFKAGVLADDRINLRSDLQFDFSMQTNVVEKVDDSHGNIKNLQVQERTWKCSCAKQRTTQTATPLDSSRKSYIQENHCTREW
jgi:hypothetical protein